MAAIFRVLIVPGVAAALFASAIAFAQNGTAKKAPEPVAPKAAQPPVPPPVAIDPFNAGEKALKDLEKLGDPAELDKALQKIPQGAGAAEAMKEMLKQMTELQKVQTEMFKSLPIRDLVKQLDSIHGDPSKQAITGPVPKGGNRGRLGARFIPVPVAAADALSLPRHHGLWIIDVWPNSPADKAGVKINDILVELAGKTVSNNYEEFMTKIFKPIQPDAEVEAVVLRKGKRVPLPGLKIPETAIDGPVQDARMMVDPRELFPEGTQIPNGIVPVGLSGNGPGAGTDHIPPLLDRGNTVRNVPGVIVRPGGIGVTDIITPRR